MLNIYYVMHFIYTLMMITIKQIQHFSAVLKSGSVQQAAEMLHITQPALTRSILNLEEHLGVQLFERNKSGMAPTDFALQVAPRLNELLLEIGDINRDAQLYQKLEIGNLRVGYGQAIRQPLTRMCVPAFIEENPNITLHLTEGTYPELVAAIQSRDIDMIIAGSESYLGKSFLSIELLHNISLTPIVRKGHPVLGLGRKIKMADILKYPRAWPTFLGDAHPFNKKFNTALDKPYPRYLSSDYYLLHKIASSTDAWTISIGSIFQKELPESLEAITVDDFDVSINLSIIELENRSRSPAASRFIETTRRVFNSDFSPTRG
ncbi:MAG: LysR family transcriptional regulator [Acidiferrobacterales bacterium]|nr:LysR family transcriptional regulator [Acidiferrobacterales bacterium]